MCRESEERIVDPEKILVKDALVEPHRAIVGPEDESKAQYEALGHAIKEWVKQEAFGSSDR